MPGDPVRKLKLLGWANFAICVIQVCLSWLIAPAVQRFPEPRESAIYGGWAARVPFIGPTLRNYFDGSSPFSNTPVFLAAYWLPLLCSTILFFLLLRTLARSRDSLTRHSSDLIYVWAVRFGLVSIFAAPMLSQDFWLSLGWGHMAAQGLNPYYVDMTPALVGGVPLDNFFQRMTYGPLWALLSGTVMYICGTNALLAGLVFKVLLAVAWIGALRLVMLLSDDGSPWHKALAVAVFGWIPLSYTQSIMEGHNDIVMALPALYWLWKVDEGSLFRARISLALSVLVKYTSAALFALDTLFSWLAAREPFKQYAKHMAVAMCLILLVFAAFYRSPAFFDAMLEMSSWHFMEPSFLANFLYYFRLGGAVFWTGRLIRLIFPALALWSTIAYCRRPSRRLLRETVLSLWAAVLLSLTSHVWPWFLIWLLGFIAITPTYRLSHWLIAVSATAPFAVVVSLSDAPGLVEWRFAITPVAFVFLLPAVVMWLFPGRFVPDSRAAQPD